MIQTIFGYAQCIAILLWMGCIMFRIAHPEHNNRLISVISLVLYLIMVIILAVSLLIDGGAI